MASNINISSGTANILTTYVGRGNRVEGVNESSNKLSINGVILYLRRHSSLNQIARDINAYERRTHVKALVTKYGNQERIILMSKSRTINIVDSSKILFNLYKNGLISTVNLKNANGNGIINYSIWNGAQLSKSLISDSTIYLLSGSPQQEREEDQRLAIVEANDINAILLRMNELEDAGYSSDEEERLVAIDSYKRGAIIQRMNELEDSEYSSDEEDRMMEVDAYKRDAIIRRMDEIEDNEYSSDEEDRLAAVDAYKRDAIIQRMNEIEDNEYSSDEEDRMMEVEAYEKQAMLKRMSELKDAYFGKHHLDNNGITSSLVWLQL